MKTTANGDAALEDLFRRYRDACPEVDASANFMPDIWEKIEARQNFSFAFERLGRTVAAASAALCLLLLVLNLFSQPVATGTFSYTDALLADHSAEKTYYTEAFRATPASLQIPRR